ncbi:DUF1153 domain-containing protein [Parasalinivibrio latis]|uniref:DUF1153 domain-containing protein n=1 Tax=Parasalinivibrio latis TaxID=2952610 RepID=UPI0030E1E6A8
MMGHDTEIKRWTAKRKLELVKEIIKGTTTTKETARTYDLTLAEVERWVGDALNGMENALRANPRNVTEQYEKKIEDLHAAYGEAMLQVKLLKKRQRYLELDED